MMMWIQYTTSLVYTNVPVCLFTTRGASQKRVDTPLPQLGRLLVAVSKLNS